MDLTLIFPQMFRLGKKIRKTQSFLKSLSRGSTVIFSSISLEKRTLKGPGRLFDKSVYQFAKE